MSRCTKAGLVILLASCLMLPSCKQEGGGREEPYHADRGEFSAADKAAARSLSIGNTSKLTAAGDPYARTALCYQAITAIEARFAGRLNQQQRDAFNQAKASLRARAQQLGPLRGKDPQAIARDLQRSSGANAERDDDAKTALACIQRLMSGDGAA